MTEERINKLYNERAFENLAKSRKKGEIGLKEIEQGKKLQQQIIDALQTMDSAILYKNRDEFTKVLKKAFKEAGINLNSSLLKAVLSALSERDETADICVDNRQPEPDPELRILKTYL